MNAVDEGVITFWPEPDKLREQKRYWKECVCGRPLFVVQKTSSKFRLPPDFKSYWPFQGDKGWVIHGTREDTERCQVRVLHFSDYPFINHYYADAIQTEARASAVHDLYARVKSEALRQTKFPTRLCACCQKPWYLVYDPVTGEPVTVHKDISGERHCAVLAKILRGAKA